jgi:hypothetical protein
MPLQQIRWLLLQPCRVATVTTMERKTTLETTVTGGVLLSTPQLPPGTATCTTVASMFPETSAISSTVFLLGVLRINVCHQCETNTPIKQ